MTTQLDPTLVTTILTRTRALIAQGWCQGLYATDAQGNSIDVQAERTCSWCVEGALYRSGLEFNTEFLHQHQVRFLELFLPREHQGKALSWWNDHPDTTQTDVLALLDRAIAGVAK